MIPAIITSTLAKHWRWVALAGAVLAIFIGLQIVQSQRDEARRQFEVAEAKRNETLAKLAVSNASISALEGEVGKQNTAIEQLSKDSETRLEAGRALILDEVRKGAKAATVAASLRDRPQVGGDQAKSSPTVLANRNLL